MTTTAQPPSETPRTDSKIFYADQAVNETVAVVTADFARRLERQRDELAEALRICRGFVDAYGQPETKERLDAILARVEAEKGPTDAH